jgi:dihydrolipoamide dehydrogenase
MVVGAVSSRSELAVIGAGPGGYVAALRAADAGLEVTLIEREQLGGTCLNVGCIPSKALIEIASLRSRATTAEAVGLHVAATVDAATLSGHLDAVSTGLRTGVSGLLKSAGVNVIRGDAHFARYDRLSIVVDDMVQHLEFDNVVIATGSRPVELATLPFDHDRIVSSTGALRLTTMPTSMAIVGGGYIGIELGTAWAKLGVPVTIVEATRSILPGTAPELVQPVIDRLAALGIRTLTETRATGVSPTGLVLDTGEDVPAEVIVVAAGRRPNTDQASIENLPIVLDPSGHIQVDQFQKAGAGIYAIGDIVSGPALAHKATAEAEVCVDAILRRPSAGRTDVIPAVIFSDPEIMSVGVSLERASELGASVHRFPHRASARAATIGDTTGATYLVVDPQQTVVGVHVVGPHASELASSAALAIELAATVEDLSLTVHPHPSISESLNEAAWLARGHPLHIRGSR